MGQAVKYAALGLALASVILLVFGIISSVTDQDIVGGFGASVARFVSTMSSIFSSVKGCLNYALGTGGSIALNLLIWLNLILPLTLIPVRIVITVYRFINQ